MNILEFVIVSLLPTVNHNKLKVSYKVAQPFCCHSTLLATASQLIFLAEKKCFMSLKFYSSNLPLTFNYSNFVTPILNLVVEFLFWNWLFYPVFFHKIEN